jgi:hypothetical protein
MADMKRMVGKSKPASEKVSNGSDTKPYNVKLMTPKELVGGKKATAKPTTKKTTKAKELTGPAAIKAIQDRTSPSGVKKAETGAKKAIDKKYPGLYKKSK